MKHTFITSVLIVISAVVAPFMSAAPPDGAPPQKEAATGNLWLIYNINTSVWPNTGTSTAMRQDSPGIYSADFDAAAIDVSKEGMREFIISSSSSQLWTEDGYVIPHWHGNQPQSEFTAPNTLRYLVKGSSGKYIQLSSELNGKYTFTLDTTGSEPTLSLTETPQYAVSVSYDGAAPTALEGNKSWSDGFTITDGAVRSLLFTINGETYGGDWTGTPVALEKGAQPVRLQGPGVFAYTLEADADGAFVLSVTKTEYVAPVHVSLSIGGAAAQELDGTEGPWSATFTVKTATTTTLDFTLNGEKWGGAKWNGADIALTRGAAPVAVDGPGIFALTLARDGDDGFRLSIDKSDYVTPITSLTIGGVTIRQNAEDNAVYTFAPMELRAGTAVTISDNEGNVYRAATAAALAAGTYTLTGSKGAATNLTASADFNYIFTATVAGRKISLDVFTYKISDSTVPAALLDNHDGSYIPEHKETIWFTRDAYSQQNNLETNGAAGVGHYGHYKDIFLIGNGRFGASVIGSDSESIILNDKANFKASLDEGNNFDNWSNHGFHGMGSLSVKRNSPAMSFNSGHLVRQLDMTTGVVTYARHDGGKYVTQEYLCSGPYDVIGMRFDAGEGGTLAYDFGLSDISGSSENFGDGYMSLTGDAGSGITTASVVARVVTDGTTTGSGSKISVSGASYLYLIVGAGTDYEMNNTTFVTGQSASELAASIKRKVDAAAEVIARDHGWAQFYQESVADHSRLFNAMKLDLDGAENDCPTDELLAEYQNQDISSSEASSTPHTRMFDILLAHMGRYIAIASSRGESNLPSNLQGMWADNAYAPWSGDYHCNINLQMNYWPCEPTGIGDTHMPLFRYMKNFAANKWRRYAEYEGGKGWIHNMGLSPFGSSYEYIDLYPEGAAWNCTHIWQHYLYTLDRSFLAEYFDTLYGCCEFLEGYMTDYDGYKVLRSFYSPEMGAGTTPAVHATQIAYQLIDATRKAALILGKSDEAARLAALQEEMHDGVDIGSNGLMCEWFGQNTSPTEDHRHLSHLMSLYPFDKIDAYADDTRRIESAHSTVLARGDTDGNENSIWCTAWKTACYARTLHGDLALRQIAYAIKNKGTIYNDLRVACKGSFQIDGSCGLSGAIPEMLMQSHRGSVEPGDTYGQIDILPALPSAWASGSVSGLRAVGGFSVDIEWSDSRADRVTVRSLAGTPLRLQMEELSEEYRVYVNGRDITTSIARNGARAAGATAYTSRASIAIPTSVGDVIEFVHSSGQTTRPTGIETVEEDAADATPVYYNIQGIRIDQPVRGHIYIRCDGRGRATKIRY
ncbi:MAG: glycoside hydrolase N-terminal domain-containing protein [Muribaculaceae bacterium]|nr:glycoside hydrolase N-terminal domain-containing protein [Muribaculaceae bacterium]